LERCLLGRPRSRWKDGIEEDLKGIDFEDRVWVVVAEVISGAAYSSSATVMLINTNKVVG
jgi:hypothetical protein